MAPRGEVSIAESLGLKVIRDAAILVQAHHRCALRAVSSRKPSGGFKQDGPPTVLCSQGPSLSQTALPLRQKPVVTGHQHLMRLSRNIKSVKCGWHCTHKPKTKHAILRTVSTEMAAHATTAKPGQATARCSSRAAQAVDRCVSEAGQCADIATVARAAAACSQACPIWREQCAATATNARACAVRSAAMWQLNQWNPHAEAAVTRAPAGCSGNPIPQALRALPLAHPLRLAGRHLRDTVAPFLGGQCVQCMQCFTSRQQVVGCHAGHTSRESGELDGPAGVKECPPAHICRRTMCRRSRKRSKTRPPCMRQAVSGVS